MGFRPLRSKCKSDSAAGFFSSRKPYSAVGTFSHSEEVFACITDKIFPTRESHRFPSRPLPSSFRTRSQKAGHHFAEAASFEQTNSWTTHARLIQLPLLPCKNFISNIFITNPFNVTWLYLANNTISHDVSVSFWKKLQILLPPQRPHGKAFSESKHPRRHLLGDSQTSCPPPQEVWE